MAERIKLVPYEPHMVGKNFVPYEVFEAQLDAAIAIGDIPAPKQGEEIKETPVQSE